MAFKIDLYPHACCGDCARYGEEIDGQCEIFNDALAGLPQNFGEMELPHTTSKCREFEPSRELLKDLADEAAYQRERDMRERAWMNGAHS